MARKKKHEEHENHERWLVSYADFITLLFAFFVVMYAISSVNEGKYRVLSSALVTAFSHPSKTVDPIQYGKPINAPIIQHKSMMEDKPSVTRLGVDHQIMPTPKEMAEMQKLADQIEINLKDLIDKELITVKHTNLGLEIEIKSKVLFASGVATISAKAVPVVKKIAAILKKAPNDINIEGYTDNLPISTEYFPSNWELSAARAASVVRLFTKSDMEPTRLKAIGFGEHYPVASNATEIGRAKNRRVAIMVLNRPDDKRVDLGVKTRARAKNKTTPFFKQKSKIQDSIEKQMRDAKKPILLPATQSIPAITTLPLKGSDAQQKKIPENKEAKEDSGSKPTLLKPVEVIKLPAIKTLLKGKGEQN